jgi:hypothetical protein
VTPQARFFRPPLRILLKKRPIYAFEFDGRRLDIGTKQDWMRANLILGLEQEPWRSTIEDVLREHAEGRGLRGRWQRPKGSPPRRAEGRETPRVPYPYRDQRDPITLNRSLSHSRETFRAQPNPLAPAPHPRNPPQWGFL